MDKLIQWVDEEIEKEKSDVVKAKGKLAPLETRCEACMVNLERLSTIRKNLSQARYYDIIGEKEFNKAYPLIQSCEHDWIPMKDGLKCKHCDDSVSIETQRYTHIMQGYTNIEDNPCS